MDSFYTFLKDNFQFLTLLFGLLSVIIAVFSLIHEMKVKKRRKMKKNEEEQQTSPEEDKPMVEE